jgi:predicted O-methyltransferase YrrM
MKCELPTLEMLMTVPLFYRGKGYYRSMELKQNMGELLGLVNCLREPPPERVCEIGTFRGGTLFIWCQVAAPSARLYSIDLPGGEFGGGYHERSVPFFQSFCQPGQTLQCFRGDSHDARVRDALQRDLNGASLDFLFLDGDHTYEGVRRDFELYAPLVRPGGHIAFHDILHRPDMPEIQVYRFWNEIRQCFRSREFIDNSPGRRKIGIGLLCQA